MTEKENLKFYELSNKFLLTHKPDNLSEKDLEKYFLGEAKDFNSLGEVFDRIIISSQNYQSMDNAIKYNRDSKRKDEIKSILFDYNIKKIQTEYDANKLFDKFKQKINMQNSQKSWLKWCKSIIDTANFLSDFENVSDFKNFVNLFNYNVQTRIALPLLIAEKIHGVGFALACNFLKELGYTEYSKPDVHLLDVFSELGFSQRNNISVFETIARMSKDCKTKYQDATPYKIDKIIWLICSGNFYLDSIKTRGLKKEFISYLRESL